MAKASKEVAATIAAQEEQKALAIISSLQEDAGGGFEGADMDAFSVPFLAILQSNSPQCKKSDGAYIEGAEEGNIYNTATGDVYNGDEGLMLVQFGYRRAYVEWVPRSEGGGFVGERDIADPILREIKKDDMGRDTLPNGNNVVDTRYHYCLLLKDNEMPKPVIVAMSSTQTKKSKKWMSRLRDTQMIAGNGQTFQPPTYSHMYHLTTVPEKNDKGSWFGWNVGDKYVVNDAEVVKIARDMKAQLVAGDLKADYDSVKENTVDADDPGF
jgi:hypothetical protein